MASSSTISIGFKIEDAGDFKKLIIDAKDFSKALNSTVKEAESLKKRFIEFSTISTGLTNIGTSIGQLQELFQDLTNATAVQVQAETQLQTVMRQRMNATDEEIQSIKNLASAQQELGIIGDEVQLVGAQQVATFLTQKQSIETLLPAMNNLLAQQKGFSATSQDAVSVGNLLGKAMQGQTSALSRVGITFTEAQEKVMQFGTETERAAMLAQIITQNVGNMNAELAKTDAGKQKQLENTLGDKKEQIGAYVQALMPYITGLNTAAAALLNVAKVTGALATVASSLTKIINLQTLAAAKNKIAILAAAAAQKTVEVATKAWAAAQQFLNLILTANPIGIIVTAIGALVGALIYAYNNCKSFREIVDKVWEAVKPLATAIMNGLARALEWLVEKCKAAWDWLKRILGLGGEKAEVDVEVNTDKKAPELDLGDLENKYSNHDPKKKLNLPKPEPPAPEGSLKRLQEDIGKLRAELELTVDDESRNKLYEQIQELENQKHEIEFKYKFPKEVEAPKVDTPKIFADKDKPLTGIVEAVETDVKKIQPQLIDVSEQLTKVKADGEAWAASEADNAKKASESKSAMAGAIGDLAGNFASLGSALELPEMNVAGTMAQAIATLVAGFATAQAQASTMGPIAWAAFGALGLAQLTAIVSSVKSLPQFADGGIISGPTIGLMGEYAGAANNPEVVAPLDKLRSLMEPAYTSGGGKVRFEIEGRKLVGVLKKEQDILSRS